MSLLLLFLGSSSSSSTETVTVADSMPSHTFTVEKRAYYKVYNSSLNFVSTWSSDVISFPSFRRNINGGPDQLVVKLARPFDNFGEGTDVALNNRIELWITDQKNNQGVNTASLWDSGIWDTDIWDGLSLPYTKMFSGYISSYSPILEGNNQYIEVVILGYLSEASRYIVRDGSGNTTITLSSEDPAQMMKDVINYYRADGGVNINYTDSTILSTGVTATYTLRHNTLKEAFDQIVALTPVNWFWYIDSDNYVHLKQASTVTADHKLTIGKNISVLQAYKSLENIYNEIYVVGGGSPNLFNRYVRSSSVVTYGKYARKIQDGQVTDNATADLIAKKLLDYYQTPETRTTLRILDDNGENADRGYDIESLQVGDTIQIKNLNYGAAGVSTWDMSKWDTDVWDNTFAYTEASILMIVSIKYDLFGVEIEASSRLPEIESRIEDVAKVVDVTLQQNLPSSPTTRVV